MRSLGTGSAQTAPDSAGGDPALTGRTSVPGWLRELDPDAAARMASAYDTSPAGTPRDIPLTPVGFAGEWRIRRRLARLARHGGRGDGARDDRFLGMTFTTRAALDHLRAHGWVGPAPDVIDDDFRLPFDWMRWRMMSLLPAATGRYPMWLWPADGPGWRRHFRWPLRGDVLLVVDVPREEVRSLTRFPGHVLCVDHAACAAVV